jgi:hypothetical protein
MTNQEQYDLLERSVRSLGIDYICFCGRKHETLCGMLIAAGMMTEVVYQIGVKRHRVPGMRGCCVPIQNFLDQAAEILEVPIKAQT